VSDEADPTLAGARARQSLGEVEMVIGAGDLDPAYLGYLADAFNAPLLYVRGNHDVGEAWEKEQEHLPEPMADGQLHDEAGLTLVGFSGSPRYAPHGRSHVDQQVSELAMWRRVLGAWPAAARRRPLLVVSHAAPRGLNDATDPAHRGFPAFRWLLDRLAPPLWIHGHTALVRRGMDARMLRAGGTLLVNVTGATLIELRPPA
jgi:Icc-related predicted phosphoesterase